VESSAFRGVRDYIGLRRVRQRSLSAGEARRLQVGKQRVHAELGMLLRVVRQLGLRKKDGRAEHATRPQRVDRAMTRRRLSALACVAIAVACACTPPPPRVPVADTKPPPLAETCHGFMDWCAYDSQCCSGNCESEMSSCR
jgi:hypothetical protein